MKIAFFCSLPIILVLFALEALGQETCHNNGGSPAGPVVDHFDASVDALVPDVGGPQHLAPLPVSPSTNATFTPALQVHTMPSAVRTAPTAKITILPANSPEAVVVATAPKVRLTIIDDAAPVARVETQPQVDKSLEPEKSETIDAAIAGLVGKWKAVARHNNGELTTVELHLDNRGWAELTVPDKQGAPSTIKSRVKFEEQELKLENGDNVTLLGKLLTFNARQMVLERAEGQVTFVRL